MKYLDNPRWPFSKIRNLNSCGHLIKHLMGRNQTKSTSLLPTVTSAPSLQAHLPESVPRSSHSSLAILCCLRDESRRSGGETVVSGHRLPPLLPVLSVVTLRRQRATDVTPAPADHVPTASTIPATGASTETAPASTLATPVPGLSGL
jgi:hypothetical protein